MFAISRRGGKQPFHRLFDRIAFVKVPAGGCNAVTRPFESCKWLNIQKCRKIAAFLYMVCLTGFEPATVRIGIWNSIQLRYRHIKKISGAFCRLRRFAFWIAEADLKIFGKITDWNSQKIILRIAKIFSSYRNKSSRHLRLYIFLKVLASGKPPCFKNNWLYFSIIIFNYLYI